ncbi:MAG: hypothetical protein K6E10_07055 [Eubacterium sp.]|nr:hypothetical protein [Eubacterium sp.]
MRQMVDELVEKPKEPETDDRLELHSMTKKERKEYKKKKFKETTEGMTPAEKRRYTFYYHKEKIIVATISIICLVILAVTLYKNTRPTCISYVVINCVDQFEFNADAIDEYAKSIGKFDGYQIHGDTNVYAKEDEYNASYEANPNSQKYISFQTLADSHYYDIVFSDMEGALYCAGMDIFYPIDKYLDQEHYDKIKDRIVVLNNMDGQPAQLAIDVSDLEFIKSLNVGYNDVYIGFAGDQESNHVAVNDFIDYLFP